MGLSRFLARQLGNPAGVFGRRVLVHLLNRGNDELISGALSTLELSPTDTFLDVGFGGGVALQKAGRVIVEGKLLGLDRSADVVRVGIRRFADWIEAGRLSLVEGDVAALPYPDGTIDKILTTNTVYFWPDLDAGLRELRRVLAPRGRIAIGITGADKMRAHYRITRHGFRIYDNMELVGALEAAGFADPRVVPQYGRHSFGDFVVCGRVAPSGGDGGNVKP